MPTALPITVVLFLCLHLSRAAEPLVSQRLELLKSLSLDEVLVTSVSKKPEKRFEAAAAVYVITGEEIVRSGVRTLPDALRLAPGVQVANLDANKWAISTRGFNDRFANKLLVLVDGRAVYTPNFAGVYWDLQDLLLEEVDRIEVIRGPGGALWGANAVNGVINIITKDAKTTPGGYVSGGYGSHDPGFGAVRWGQAVGKNGFLRAYAKYDNHDDFPLPNGSDGNDHWDTGRAGFRTDWDLEANHLTFQGDYFYGHRGTRLGVPSFAPPFSAVLEGDALARGANVLGRWGHTFADGTDLSLQTYYDYFSRTEVEHVFGEYQHAFDLDYQHRLLLPLRQELIYGLGYRLVHHAAVNRDLLIQYVPPSRDLHLFSGLLQDEITLVEDRLRLVLGSKFEHHEYTGIEVLPNARVVWTPADNHTLWGAISRAVRTPSRGERDAQSTFPTPFPGVFARTLGNPEFGSEELLSYELGYRVRPLPKLSLDLALFYVDYDHLGMASTQPQNGFLEATPPPLHLIIPAQAVNQGHAWSRGAELASQWELADWWRLRAGYNYLDTHIPTEAYIGLKDPSHQVFARSMMDLGDHWHLDLVGRYVDPIHYRSAAGMDDVPAYVTADVRLAWNPVPKVEVALVGRNLVEPRHREFVPQFLYASEITSVPRSIFGQVTVRF